MNKLGAFNDLDSLHGAQIDGSAVIDLFRGQDGAADDIIYVCPITDLSTVSPYVERVLTNECPGSHGYHCVVLFGAGAIHGEVTA